MSPAVTAELRTRGFDVVDQRDVLKASASDLEVMAEAWRDRRILVAHDYDMGELVLRGFAQAEGVMIVAFDFESAATEADRLSEVVRTLGDRIVRQVHVIGPSGIRSRPFDPP